MKLKMLYHKRCQDIIKILVITICISSCSEKIPVLETGSQKPMPEKWIDDKTGHKIIRLSNTEGDNRSFYFHNNPFIPSKDRKGDIMVFYNGRKRQSDRFYGGKEARQLYMINLKTMKIKPLTDHPLPVYAEIVAKNRREVFYQIKDTVFSVNVDSRESKIIFVFPDSLKKAAIAALNADETLLAGAFSSNLKDSILMNNPKKSDFFRLIYEAKLKHTLFTLNIETGEIQYIHSDTAWINHVQFSPTNPNLIMFCHEGPWHKVDRIWTIDINERKPKLMHKRTMENEIAGHEFFSPDGKKIWFDLQMPRGTTFYLASTDIETGELKKFAHKRDEWSIHYNISPDMQIFAGDGGDSTQVAKAKDGQWIYLFTPAGDSLKAERLVNMKNHDYDLEPNVHFSPDGKWIIFRANFEGKSQIYAVEIDKSNR